MKTTGLILLFVLPFFTKSYFLPLLIEREVYPGKTVILQCVSNDHDHLFMYWYFNKDNIVIGPSNHFNRGKFDYEVLSGNLTVVAITPNESGMYYCVSQGIDLQDILISSVRLQVLIYNEDDSSSAAFVIACSVLASIFVALCGIYGGFLLYYKRKDDQIAYINTNDEEEDDSIDELFTREPSTSQKHLIKDQNGTMDDFSKVHTMISINDQT